MVRRTTSDDPGGVRHLALRYAVTRWLVRVVFGLHAVLAVAQPVLAGHYLSGNLSAIRAHSTIGGSLIGVGVLALIAAILLWWPGRGPWWPVLASLVLLVVEVVEVATGFARTLGLHVPLGVAVVGGAALLFGWSVLARSGPRPPRAAAPGPTVSPHPTVP